MNEGIEAPAQITATLNIGLDFPVDHHYKHYGVQVGEGDWEEHFAPQGPITVLDIVIDQAARQLVYKLTKDDVYPSFRDRVGRAIDQTVQRRVEALVDAEMQREWQPVDTAGVPTAARTKLVDMVTKKANEALTFRTPEQRRDNGFGNDRGPRPLEAALDQVTRQIIDKELSTTLAEAKADLTGRVRAVVADSLAAKLVAELKP